MSDTPQGPGWWQASDGRWYPPSLSPGWEVPSSPGQTPATPPSGNKSVWRKFRALPTAMQVIAWAVVFFVVVGAIGAATSQKKKTTVTQTGLVTLVPSTLAPHPTHVTTAPSTAAPTTSRATAPPTTAAPPPTTAVPLTAPPATAPPATSTPPTSPAVVQTASVCGAPSNPYGYNFCQRGSLIYHPASDVCSYFDCIPNFPNGTGYMVECNDSTYSMSGGHSGACSYHDGEERPVYSGP